MVLCENRPEGFGPKSTFSKHLPTTCFNDVIVVPLAVWIYLITVAVTVPLLRSTRSATVAKTKVSASGGKSWPVFRGILSVIYYLLIVAMLAMMSLEIARLSVAQLGIGLLPFIYVGILGALALHVSAEPRLSHRLGGQDDRRWRRVVRFVNGFFWALLLCAMAIKVAAEAEEERVAGHRTGTQARYPLSDSITDDSTMVGVELILLVLEFITI